MLGVLVKRPKVCPLAERAACYMRLAQLLCLLFSLKGDVLDQIAVIIIESRTVPHYPVCFRQPAFDQLHGE